MVAASSGRKQLNCERCSRPHSGSYGSSRFCSVRCAKQVGAAARRRVLSSPAGNNTAMLPVPAALPRPIPMRSTTTNTSSPSVPAAGSGNCCSSPPRKKAARSDSPTTIAIAINAKPSIQQPVVSASSPASSPAVSRLRCESCDKPHDGSYGSGRFCAVHCARRTAAALKWSKKRANRNNNTTITAINRASNNISSSSSLSAPVSSVAPAASVSVSLPTLAMVHPPSALPPLPPEDLPLGKRSHPSIIAPLPHPHPHLFPFPYAPSPSCTPHAVMQPHFASSYPYHTTTAPIAPMASASAAATPRLGEPVQQAPAPYPVSYPMPIPIAVPVAGCYGYPPSAVPYGPPYVPVHYGPIPGVSSVGHSTSPIVSTSITMKSQSEISVSLSTENARKKYEHITSKEGTVTAAKDGDDSGGKEGSSKGVKKSEEDSAAAAEVLMSMFHKKAP